MATTNEYQVTGMTCGHCEMSVREEVGELSGVTDIQVSAQTGRLIVTSEETLDDAQVITAVEHPVYSDAKTRRMPRDDGSPTAPLSLCPSEAHSSPPEPSSRIGSSHDGHRSLPRRRTSRSAQGLRPSSPRSRR